MKAGDIAYTPQILFKDTKANIEARTNLVIGMEAYATDNPTAPHGIYNGTTWDWFPFLDDKTSFTPVIEGTSTVGVGTYTSQLGVWARIGNMVFFNISLVWTSHTGSGNMIITGLPVTSYATMSAAVNIYWSGITLSAVGNKIIGFIPSSNTQITLQEIGSGNASALALDTAGTIRLTGFYFV